jgi:hypothetical protein
MLRAALLVAALAFAPLAHADDDSCKLALGRGWPPATENYGAAVEKLFSGDVPPALSFTLLPSAAAESGLLLIPSPAGGDWALRHVVADERVRVWSGGQLQLRTEQSPVIDQRPIPAAVATRLLEDWREVLSAAAPEGSSAPFNDGDTWVFMIADPAHREGTLRVSGLKPTCEAGALLREQIDLLIEASDEGDEKREKRWRQLGESLDRMRDALGTSAATAAQ